MKPERYFEVYGEERADVPALVRAGQFCSRHSGAVAMAVVCALLLLASAYFATTASGIPLPAGQTGRRPIDVGDAGGGDLFGLSAPLRAAVNFLLGIMSWFLDTTINCDLLTSPLNEVWDQSGVWGSDPATGAANRSVMDVIVGIQRAAVIPVAYIILICVFTMGLVKLMQGAGWNEGGIDLYKMIVLFVMLGIGKGLIDNSVEILGFVYDQCRVLILGVQEWAGAADVVSLDPIPDDVTDLGLLLGLLLMCLVLTLVTAVCAIVINMSVIMRTIQVLLFVWAAPLPLAFFISEDGRGIATGFLKRFLGVVLAGAVLILMFVIFTVLLGAALGNYQSLGGGADIGAWFSSLMELLPILACYAYMCFKSGELAQQIIGQ